MFQLVRACALTALLLTTTASTATPPTAPPELTPLIWDGGAGDGLWSSATNWDLDVKPGLAHACRIGGAHVRVEAQDAVAGWLEVYSASSLEIVSTGRLLLDGGTIAGTLGGDGILQQTDDILILETGVVAPTGTLTVTGKKSMRIDGALAAIIDADGAGKIHLPYTGRNEVNTYVGQATLELTAVERATFSGPPDGSIFGRRDIVLIDNDGDGGLSGIGAMTTPPVDAHLGAGVFFRDARFVDGIKQQLRVDVFQATPGDQNGDRKFESADIDAAFALGGDKFGTDLPADWLEGDFDGDGNFDQDDIDYAHDVSGKYFNRGSYYPVPEPTALALCLVACLSLAARAARREPIRKR